MTKAAASSAGCAARCKGTCLPKFCTASSGIVERINGVQIGPGATAFARNAVLRKHPRNAAGEILDRAFGRGIGQQNRNGHIRID
jgi:hypothetical protein